MSWYNAKEYWLGRALNMAIAADARHNVGVVVAGFVRAETAATVPMFVCVLCVFVWHVVQLT